MVYKTILFGKENIFQRFESCKDLSTKVEWKLI